MTAVSTPINPMQAAMQPQAEGEHIKTYFGEVAIVDAYFVALVKGKGKEVYDDTQHPAQGLKKHVNIKLALQCEKRDQTLYLMEREAISWSKEWKEITFPSLAALGIVDLNELKGKWASVVLVPFDTYKNSAGETKDRTAFRFEMLFNDAASCKAAADTFYQKSDDAVGRIPEADLPDDLRHVGTPPAASAPVDTKQRDFALNSARSLWTMTGGDQTTFRMMYVAAGLDKHVPVDEAIGEASLPF